MKLRFALALAALALFIYPADAQRTGPGRGGGSAIVAKQTLTSYSGTAAIAAATIYTPATAGEFRMCGFSVLSVGATTGSYTLLANWTVAGHAFVGGQMGKSVGNAQWDWNGAGVVQPPCLTFWADAGTNIQFSLGSSVTGTPTLQYAWTLERLQ